MLKKYANMFWCKYLPWHTYWDCEIKLMSDFCKVNYHLTLDSIKQCVKFIALLWQLDL